GTLGDRNADGRLGPPAADSDESQNGIPNLKGDDWVIIKIDLPPEHPEQQSPTSAAPGTVTTPLNQQSDGTGMSSTGNGPGKVSRFRAVELSQEEKEKH